METISNYPKLARVRIVFYIEVGYLIFQTFICVAAIILFNKLSTTLAEKRATNIDYALIFGTLIVFALLYIVEVGLVALLYLGIKQKSRKKLMIWVLVNIAVLAVLIVVEVIERTEKGYIGDSPSIIQLVVFLYRLISVSVVYDSIRELKRFPISVPFVQMSCDESV